MLHEQRQFFVWDRDRMFLQSHYRRSRGLLPLLTEKSRKVIGMMENYLYRIVMPDFPVSKNKMYVHKNQKKKL